MKPAGEERNGQCRRETEIYRKKQKVKKIMKNMNRRNFVKGAALLGVSSFVPYTWSPKSFAQAQGKDRLRLGAIGVGSQGRLDLSYFNMIADLVAICDIDAEYGLAETIKAGYGRKKNGKVIAPDSYADYRKILDRDDIEAVMIATPDHWHTKIAVEALQAGKHVFCEKPLTLTLEENILIRKAAEKYKRIFQVGTMQRSFRKEFMLATLIVRSGALGKIRKVTVDVGGGPSSPGIPQAVVPKCLDWNVWLGQAPETPYLASDKLATCPWEPRPATRPEIGRGHFVFRWWYEYSGGKFTDWGAHHIDCALWALNRQAPGTGPVSIDGVDSEHPVPYKDGYPTVNNQYNTASRFNIYHTFDDGMIMNVTSSSKDGSGILFEGTEGRIHVSRGRVKGKVVEEGIAKTFKEEDFLALNNGVPFHENKAGRKGQDYAFYEHKCNFITCIRQGGKPICDVASHVQAAHLCHLSGIAARLKRKINWDSKTEKIVGDEQAASFFSREQRKGFELPEV